MSGLGRRALVALPLLLLLVASPVASARAAAGGGVDEVARSMRSLIEELDATAEQPDWSVLTPPGSSEPSVMEILNGFAPVFLIAFAVTLFATPLVRRAAIIGGIIDRPDEARKMHRVPIAYLGGVAVFLGLITAILAGYVTPTAIGLKASVPLSIIVGMVAITFTGFADDVWKWDPRTKIAGQLVAAAALAIEDIGVNVANGLLSPIFGPDDAILLTVFDVAIPNSALFYWVGTAIVAVFVLGGCNATNLLDGLDGLLSGVIAIVAMGLLAISILLAIHQFDVSAGPETASMVGTRIILCMALAGAVLGFLPHNFNPAVIFLGDAGSLLLGYMCVVIILMLGDTHLVFAGLIIFALPIMDTTLAIIRRILAGVPLSTADAHHIHHQFKRTLGTVKRAVVALYGLSAVFAVLGVTLAALVMFTELKVRVLYTVAFVLFSFVGVMAVKAARQSQMEQAVLERVAGPGAAAAPPAAPTGRSVTVGDAARPGSPVG